MDIPNDQIFAALARRCCHNGEFGALRARLGWSVRQTADILGVDSSEVSRWSRGLNGPKKEAPALGRLIAGWMALLDTGERRSDTLSDLAVQAVTAEDLVGV